MDKTNKKLEKKKEKLYKTGKGVGKSVVRKIGMRQDRNRRHEK